MPHPHREEIIDALVNFMPHKVIMRKWKVSSRTLQEYTEKYIETVRRRKDLPPDQSDGQFSLFSWANRKQPKW